VESDLGELDLRARAVRMEAHSASSQDRRPCIGVATFKEAV